MTIDIPITRKEYEKGRSEYWKGKRVNSLRTLRNRNAEMPPGTIYRITYKYNGFDLQSEPCEKCGIKFSISRVPYHFLTLIEEE